MAHLESKTALTFDDVLLEPCYSEIASRLDTNTSTTLIGDVTLQIPIISSNMDTVTESAMAIAMAEAGGCGVLHRFMPIETQVKMVSDVVQRRMTVGASIGVKGAEDVENAKRLIDAGATFIVVDVAHAHSSNVRDLVGRHGLSRLMEKFHFMGGNVATAMGAEFLARLGFKSVKTGVGSGSICTTRVVTGFGVPQLTAIMDCADVCDRYGVTLIADGGIRNSGDLVKALAAGCDAVMMGSVLAGTEESPGRKIQRNGALWKNVRGMASLGANVSRKALEGTVTEEYVDSITPEGVEAMVPYRGHVKDVLAKMIGGLRSGMSYAGAHTIQELSRNAVFIPITNSGLKESHPHDVIL